jgi:hypothetical protein
MEREKTCNLLKIAFGIIKQRKHSVSLGGGVVPPKQSASRPGGLLRPAKNAGLATTQKLKGDYSANIGVSRESQSVVNSPT